jgi:hypothetical protein
LYALDFLFNGGNRCWYALDKSPKRQARCRRRRRPRASTVPVTSRARQRAERTTRKELLLRARAHLFNDFPPFARRPVANLARCRCFHVLLAARGSFFSAILALGLSASASRSGACEPINCHHSHASGQAADARSASDVGGSRAARSAVHGVDAPCQQRRGWSKRRHMALQRTRRASRVHAP